MKNIKYFFQFLLAITCFAFFKLLGPTYSSNLSGKLFEKIGPFFRPKKIIYSNIRKAIPNISEEEINNFTKSMWNNYGRVFAEYMFIKDFRLGKLESKVEINGQEIKEYIFNPQDYGFKLSTINSLIINSVNESKEIMMGIFNNQIQDSRRDICVLNSGAGLYISGNAKSFEEAFLEIESKITSGEIYSNFLKILGK